jgi:glycerophosphoryl diester phosphodiesterase
MAFQYNHKIGVAAHRGDSYNHYENTMTAFRAALAAGADMIETDVRLTKDLIPILIHDARVDRTTDGTGEVKDFTLAALSALNAADPNAPEKIPLFEEFLAWVKATDLTVNIEIKEYCTEGNEERCRLCIEKVIALVEQYGMAERILINSFDAYVLEYCYKKWGKRYPLHGFYPYSIMHMENATLDPAEYLFCACIFDTKRKVLYDDLISKGIEPWIGAGVTQAALLGIAIQNGARLITTNFPADIIKKLEKI